MTWLRQLTDGDSQLGITFDRFIYMLIIASLASLQVLAVQESKPGAQRCRESHEASLETSVSSTSE